MTGRWTRTSSSAPAPRRSTYAKARLTGSRATRTGARPQRLPTELRGLRHRPRRRDARLAAERHRGDRLGRRLGSAGGDANPSPATGEGAAAVPALRRPPGRRRRGDRRRDPPIGRDEEDRLRLAAARDPAQAGEPPGRARPAGAGASVAWLEDELVAPLARDVGRPAAEPGQQHRPRLRRVPRLRLLPARHLLLASDSDSEELSKDKKLYFGDPLLHSVARDLAPGVANDVPAQVENAIGLALYHRYESPASRLEGFDAPADLHVWPARAPPRVCAGSRSAPSLGAG